MRDEEKRKFTRVLFRTQIRILSASSSFVANTLRNISLGGAFIETTYQLPEGAPCALEIDLTGPASLLRVQVEGDVVRCENDGIAVKFTKIDLDSLIHLRHLIKVHAEDPDTINNEYEGHLLEVTVTRSGTE
jgi:hypothetical protein